MKACSGRVKAKAKQLVDTVAAKKGAPGEPVTSKCPLQAQLTPRCVNIMQSIWN